MDTPAVTAVADLEPALPSAWYRSDSIYQAEVDRIFRREWMCVGREEQLPGPGAHTVLEVVGESILLLRNRDGALRAFFNVCRHRGARLCRSGDTSNHSDLPALSGVIAGRGIVCPYHRWSYDLDGHLIGAPHLPTLRPSDRASLSLYPVAVDTWGGFVFVHLTPSQASPLAAQLGGIPSRTERYPLNELRIARTINYRVRANWKVVCENNNECYHCGAVHPELCEVVPAFGEGGANLDWANGVPHRPGATTFTASGTSRRRSFPDLNPDERVRHKGELAYPNLFVSLACDHVAAFILQPRSAGYTDITCHFLFEPYELAKVDFDAADTVDFWDRINRQDWAICEAVQEGMHARIHEHGYYAPMEDYNLDLRRYVLDRLGIVLESAACAIS